MVDPFKSDRTFLQRFGPWGAFGFSLWFVRHAYQTIYDNYVEACEGNYQCSFGDEWAIVGVATFFAAVAVGLITNMVLNGDKYE